MTRSSSIVLALSLALSVTACSNPAEGKPQAKVEEAAPEKAEQPEAAAKAGATFAVDAEASKLGFVGSKVTGSHEGGFKAFTAQVSTAEGKVEGGSVSVEIDIDSMFSDSENLTTHLKTADFFDAAVKRNEVGNRREARIAEGGSDSGGRPEGVSRGECA